MPDEGGQPWFVAKGTNLIVETDLDANDARKLVGDLELWRAAMTVAVFRDARPPQQELDVIVLRNRELSALVPDLDGVFSHRRFLDPMLLLGANETSRRADIMKHELAHAVVDENMPQAPRWLNEGLASMLETTDLDEKTGAVTWGALPRVPSGYIRYELSPLREVLGSRAWSEEKGGKLTYSAKFLVHMLARTHPREFNCLLARLSQQVSYEDARSGCFGDAVNWTFEYGKEYFQYGGHDLGSTMIDLNVTRVNGDASLERMSDADVHAALALVNLVTSTFHDEEVEQRRLLSASEQHRKRALALVPTQMLAATLELTSHGFDAAKGPAWTAELVRANPSDWRAWMWRVRIGGLTTESQLDEAFARLAALAPDRTGVIGLRAAYALRAEKWQEAEQLARRALAQGDTEPLLDVVLDLALERQGKCDEARAFLAQAGAAQHVHAKLAAPPWSTVPRPMPCPP